MTNGMDPLLLLRAGRLLDGTGGPAQERMAVLVQGSKIKAVGPEHELGLPDGAAGEVLEFPDATLCLASSIAIPTPTCRATADGAKTFM